MRTMVDTMQLTIVLTIVHPSASQSLARDWAGVVVNTFGW